MRITTIIFTLIISINTFSQNIWKKQAELKRKNEIKETFVYLQDINNENKKELWNWYLFDKKGRIIETKRFLINGKFKTHYKFKYPTNETRILISLDKRGKKTERIQQIFDLSDRKDQKLEYSKNGIFRYEYDDNGNKVKVWRIKNNPPLLEIEVFFNKQDLRIKENLLMRKQDRTTFILTRFYERDNFGNILKIVSKKEGIIDNIEIHEHKK